MALFPATSWDHFLLILLRVSGPKTTALFRRMTRLFPTRLDEGLLKSMDEFTRGIFLPGSWFGVAAIFLYTFLLGSLYLVTIYCVSRAFGLELPWHAPIILLVMQAIGVMVPSSPAFVGTFHAAAAIGLRLYGASESLALSYAVVVHLASFASVVFIGVAFLWRDNLSLSGLSARNRGTIG